MSLLRLCSARIELPRRRLFEEKEKDRMRRREGRERVQQKGKNTLGMLTSLFAKRRSFLPGPVEFMVFSFKAKNGLISNISVQFNSLVTSLSGKFVQFIYWQASNFRTFSNFSSKLDLQVSMAKNGKRCGRCDSRSGGRRC